VLREGLLQEGEKDECPLVLRTMNKKTTIAVLWPLSILFALWFGSVLGTKFGIRVGMAMYHNEHVRMLQMELSDAAESCTDQKIKETLLAVQQLILVIDDPEKWSAAGDTFSVRLKELQNEPSEGIGPCCDKPPDAGVRQREE
jgi:hypothetical protein